jgi:hypothetical protein
MEGLILNLILPLFWWIRQPTRPLSLVIVGLHWQSTERAYQTRLADMGGFLFHSDADLVPVLQLMITDMALHQMLDRSQRVVLYGSDSTRTQMNFPTCYVQRARRMPTLIFSSDTLAGFHLTENATQASSDLRPNYQKIPVADKRSLSQKSILRSLDIDRKTLPLLELVSYFGHSFFVRERSVKYSWLLLE